MSAFPGDDMRTQVPVCLYGGSCSFQGQDKKTKLPICKNYDRKKGAYNYCSQQYFLSAHAMRNVGSVEELRRRRFQRSRRVFKD